MGVRQLVWILGVVCALGLGLSSAFGTTLLRALPLADLVAEADVVLQGRVLQNEVVRDEETGRISTRNHVSVLEIWKGDLVSDRVAIIQPGGRWKGGVSVAVASTARFQHGEEVVVFLRRAGDLFALVGMNQGKFTVESASGRQEAHRGAASGGRSQATSSSTVSRMELTELKQRVRALLGASIQGP